MSRWVVPKSTGLKRGEGEAPDGPLGRIAKYVPAEIVSPFTMFVALFTALKLPGVQPKLVALFLIVVFLLATIGYVARSAPKGPVRKAHLIVTPLSFLAWSYAVSSGLLGPWYLAVVALLAQVVVVALSIAIDPHTS